MPEKTNLADELFRAVESIKPDAAARDHAWYIGRRESGMQKVLARAGSESRAGAWASKPRRRAVLAGGLSLALLGGGTAYAISNQAVDWYIAGGMDGVTCVTSWHDPFEIVQRPDQYGGAILTTDPIADCNRYADLTGKARIADPAAVRYYGALVVGPRAGAPAGAIPAGEWQAPLPSGAAVPAGVTRNPVAETELEQSLGDLVDGGNSRCWDAASGEAFARAELDRLGLAGWTTRVSEQNPSEGACAFMFVPATPGEVVIRAHGQTDPKVTDASLPVSALRTRIAQQCLSLGEAEQVVREAIGENVHHWPTSAQLDEGASCTRVDLVVGGSQQVFLHGPQVARR